MSLASLAKNIAKLSTGTGLSAKNLLENTNKVKDLERGLSISEITELLSETGLAFDFELARPYLSTDTLQTTWAAETITYDWVLNSTNNTYLDNLAQYFLGSDKFAADLLDLTWKDLFHDVADKYHTLKSKGFSAAHKESVVGTDHKHVGMIVYKDNDNFDFVIQHVINRNAQYFTEAFLVSTMLPLIAASLKVAREKTGGSDDVWVDGTTHPNQHKFQQVLGLSFIYIASQFYSQFAALDASIANGNTASFSITTGTNSNPVTLTLANSTDLYKLEYIINIIVREGLWLANPSNNVGQYSTNATLTRVEVDAIKDSINNSGDISAPLGNGTYLTQLQRVLFGPGYAGIAMCAFEPDVLVYGDFVDALNANYNTALISSRTTSGTTFTVNLVYYDLNKQTIAVDGTEIYYIDIDIKNTEGDSIVNLQLRNFGNTFSLGSELFTGDNALQISYVLYDSSKHLSSYTINIADIKTKTDTLHSSFSTFSGIIFS